MQQITTLIKSILTFFHLILITIICGAHSLVLAQGNDIKWLRQINGNNSSFKNNYSRICANSATPLSIGVPIGMYIFDVIKTKKYKQSKAIVIGISLISTSVITTSLKHSINRTRPYITYPDLIKRSSGGSPSFPSGHTSTAFALATSLSLEYRKWYVIAPAYIWASSVAYSRMYQGVHYPSDVVAGAIIGSGCAVLCKYLNKKYMKF